MWCLSWIFEDGKQNCVIGIPESLSTVYFWAKIYYPTLKFSLKVCGGSNAQALWFKEEDRAI